MTSANKICSVCHSTLQPPYIFTEKDYTKSFVELKNHYYCIYCGRVTTYE